MKHTLCILVLCAASIVFINADGAWMGSFKQRGSATHGLKSSELVAAHPSLPLKTKVQVTNLQNNKQIVVTISARIAASGNRIIDLSQQAAAALGLAERGVTAVSIETVRERPSGSGSK
jgi:rare lipoprotein A